MAGLTTESKTFIFVIQQLRYSFPIRIDIRLEFCLLLPFLRFRPLRPLHPLPLRPSGSMTKQPKYLNCFSLSPTSFSLFLCRLHRITGIASIIYTYEYKQAKPYTNTLNLTNILKYQIHSAI